MHSFTKCMCLTSDHKNSNEIEKDVLLFSTLTCINLAKYYCGAYFSDTKFPFPFISQTIINQRRFNYWSSLSWQENEKIF